MAVITLAGVGYGEIVDTSHNLRSALDSTLASCCCSGCGRHRVSCIFREVRGLPWRKLK